MRSEVRAFGSFFVPSSARFFFHRAAAAFFACARRCAFVSPSHFARDALLADALRCSGVRLRLRALPP
jgi:hypothetical protein